MANCAKEWLQLTKHLCGSTTTIEVLHRHAEDFQVLQCVLRCRLDRPSLNYHLPQFHHLLRVWVFVGLPHHCLLVGTIDILRNMQRDRQTFDIWGIILQPYRLGCSVYFYVCVKSRDIVDSGLVGDCKVRVPEENATETQVLAAGCAGDGFYLLPERKA